MKSLIGVLVAAAAVFAVAVPGAAGVSAVSAVGPKEKVGGKSFSQLLTADWQSLLARGHLIISEPKTALGCLTVGQSGKVWFLQDAYEGPTPVTVTCHVPAGRYLFLEGPGFECSTIEPAPYKATRAGLPGCAASFALKGADITVDGTPVTATPVATPVFRFSIPARGNVLKTVGRTRGYGAAHADVVMLRPLAAGAHTIVQMAHYASGQTAQTTWQLTVG
jgi:hypothetical protein